MSFDADFLRRLESLRLAVRRALQGRREGERTGRRRGGGAEFHSHRAYAPGDDFRAIDWSLYARVGHLFVQQKTREEAPLLSLIVDASPSMGFGAPPKLEVARRLAAVLGWLAIGEGGTVVLDGRTFEGDPVRSGFLDAAERAGSAHPVEALRRHRGPALVTFFSDLWDEGLADALSGVASASRGLTLVHLLSRPELSPPERGTVRFTDSESGEAVPRFVGEEEAAEYARLLEEHCRDWREWAGRREAGYLRCASDEPFDEIVMVHLRGEGLIE